MDDDDRSVWENHALQAVHQTLDNAKFDEIRGTIIVPSFDSGFSSTYEFSNIDELNSHLYEIYTEQWYANVPFDSGEAVFEDDASGYIDDLISSKPEIEIFFDTHGKFNNDELLVNAHELLEDGNSSSIVRIDVDEINEELIQYLTSHPEKMREMSPRKFEELIAEMFKTQGYEVELTPKSKDGGMDVVAMRKDGVGTVMIIIECKRYSETNKVGVEIARGLYGVVEQKGATRGIIATTSFFTRGAVEFRNTVPYRLGLSDFNTLKEQIKDWKS